MNSLMNILRSLIHFLINKYIITYDSVHQISFILLYLSGGKILNSHNNHSDHIKSCPGSLALLYSYQHK